MSTGTPLADDRPTDPDDELLVAYLDGELDMQSRDEVEQRLLDSESLRRRLQHLQSGWDWLDELPEPGSSEQLVESTLELVVADIVKQTPVKKHSIVQLRNPILIVLACVIAATIGYALVTSRRTALERQQLADLALAENLQAYQLGCDIDLMRDLQANQSWRTMVTTLQEFGKLTATPSTTIENAPIAERAAVISGLSVEKRSRLESRWDLFQRLDDASVAEIRETAAKVKVAPDAESLLKTMAAYAAWLEGLPNDLRDKIEQGDARTRMSGIEEAVAHTLKSVSRESGSMLDEDTVERIYFVLKQLLEYRMKADPELQSSIEQQIDTFGDGAERMNLSVMLGNDRLKQPQGRGVLRGKFPPPITREELDSIIDILSDSAIDDLNLLTNWSPFGGRDSQLAEITLRAWAEETLRRKRSFRGGEDNGLLERYLALPERERDEIDLMSPQQIRTRLSSWGRFGGRPPRPSGR